VQRRLQLAINCSYPDRLDEIEAGPDLSKVRASAHLDETNHQRMSNRQGQGTAFFFALPALRGNL
jgi:hypothetical protein